MQDNNVAAPASTGEAAPLNPVEAPQAPATTEGATAPTLTNEDVAKFLGMSPETLAGYQNMAENNGGWDKGLSTYKKAISGRQADPMAQAPIPQPAPMNDNPALQVTSQPEPTPQPVQGGITAEEFLIRQYFDSLASQDQYKNIAEQMRSGEVLKEMAKFDIQPMVNGQFNDAKVRNFLGLYSKSMPAPEPTAPVTPTPTVEYVQVGETITNTSQAMAVLAQDAQLRAAGKEGHPMAKEANEFFDQAYTRQNQRGKTTHMTLDEKLKLEGKK